MWYVVCSTGSCALVRKFENLTIWSFMVAEKGSGSIWQLKWNAQ
jgi:hypothetical protein